MEATTQIKRFGEHRNGFGFLRLLFASLVIVSHVSDYATGDMHREILIAHGSAISFGGLSVDAFFTISAFLIVGSYLKDGNARSFLTKRVLRIYPAFLVASAISVFVVAPLGHGVMDGHTIWVAVKRMITLRHPEVDGVYPGLPIQRLNDTLWTIIYEFSCYVMVLALGKANALRASVVVPLGLLMLIVWGYHPYSFAMFDNAPVLRSIYPIPSQLFRLVGIYLVGLGFFLERHRISYTVPGCLVAIILLVPSALFKETADLGMATAGAYLVLAFAEWASSGVLSHINNRDDVSYGVYLYGTLAIGLILWSYPHLPLSIVTVVSWAVAYICGWVSWLLIEKPAMRLLRPVSASGLRLISARLA